MISETIRFLAMMIIGSGVLSLSACDASAPSGNSTVSTPDAKPQPDEIVRNWTLRFINDLQWERARKQYSNIKQYKYDMTEFNAAIEAKLLEAIPTLPEENHDLILNGYEFLARLQPDNPDYKDKVLHYMAIKQAFQKASIAKLENYTDKIDDVTWYKHPRQSQVTTLLSGIELYIGRVGGGPPILRMKTQYTSDKWLFVTMLYAWHDGKKELLVKESFDRGYGSGFIWEWIDKKPTPRQIITLKSVAHSKEAILRFESDKNVKDVIVSGDDKRAIAEMLAAYEGMVEEHEAAKE